MAQPLEVAQDEVACDIPLVKAFLGHKVREDGLAEEAPHEQVLGNVPSGTRRFELGFALVGDGVLELTSGEDASLWSGRSSQRQ